MCTSGSNPAARRAHRGRRGGCPSHVCSGLRTQIVGCLQRVSPFLARPLPTRLGITANSLTLHWQRLAVDKNTNNNTKTKTKNTSSDAAALPSTSYLLSRTTRTCEGEISIERPASSRNSATDVRWVSDMVMLRTSLPDMVVPPVVLLIWQNTANPHNLITAQCLIHL